MDQEHVVAVLKDAFSRPLTHPGSAQFAERVFSNFPQDELWSALATKSLQTLGDRQRHDCALVSPSPPRIALWFIAWPGTHLATLPGRYGEYLEKLFAMRRLIQGGIDDLLGVLQVDAYLRSESDDSVVADAEFTFLPTDAPFSSENESLHWVRVFMLNTSLCTADQRKRIERAQMRSG